LSREAPQLGQDGIHDNADAVGREADGFASGQPQKTIEGLYYL
jgi:hypothetical protein